MCHRITPLLLSDLQEALKNLQQTGHAHMPQRSGDAVPDAYPGTQLPLFVPGQDGQLEAKELTWGFQRPGDTPSKLIFNTRIETALAQAESGRGMWSEPILRGRCLVPVRCFYESWTKSPPRRGTQVRFTLPQHAVFLLAGIYQDERFTVMTTTPSADVAHIHSRMPLVLAPGESSLWLGPHFANLRDRASVRLTVEPEE